MKNLAATLLFFMITTALHAAGCKDIFDCAAKGNDYFEKEGKRSYEKTIRAIE